MKLAFMSGLQICLSPRIRAAPGLHSQPRSRGRASRRDQRSGLVRTARESLPRVPPNFRKIQSHFPQQPDEAVAAAVYLHGLAGQLGARELGEKSLIATDILRYLPRAIERAMEACAGVPDAI